MVKSKIGRKYLEAPPTVFLHRSTLRCLLDEKLSSLGLPAKLLMLPTVSG